MVHHIEPQIQHFCKRKIIERVTVQQISSLIKDLFIT
jgi:hypothetical protein